jgi:hypothetical protein
MYSLEYAAEYLACIVFPSLLILPCEKDDFANQENKAIYLS